MQPALPEYRIGFFSALAGLWPGELVVAHGADSPNTPANDRRPGPYRRIELPWSDGAGGAQLRWPEVRRATDGASLIIVPGDPHLLASHRLLARRLAGGPPVVALSQFRGADARWLPSLLKPWWHRLFDGTILYTRREAQHYLALGQRADRLAWLDNGLARLPPLPGAEDLAARWRCGPFVCLGRHVAKNRFDLALRGFADYRRTGGRRRLELIGQGPETAALRLLVQAWSPEVAGAVAFAGAIYDPRELDARLGSCAAAVHPLAMGLSINTAAGYGLPAIACADARRHMPEFWIWREGTTGIGFPAPRGREEASVPGIAAALHRFDALPPGAYAAMARACHAAVAPLTTDAMAARVAALCRSLAGKERPCAT